MRQLVNFGLRPKAASESLKVGALKRTPSGPSESAEPPSRPNQKRLARANGSTKQGYYNRCLNQRHRSQAKHRASYQRRPPRQQGEALEEQVCRNAQDAREDERVEVEDRQQRDGGNQPPVRQTCTRRCEYDSREHRRKRKA